MGCSIGYPNCRLSINDAGKRPLVMFYERIKISFCFNFFFSELITITHRFIRQVYVYSV